MDKNFIQNCKLLKQHFTQLTQADTTAQSKCGKSSNSTEANTIINDARKLLLSEQIEALSDEDIAKIREKSVDQYAREMKHYHANQNYRLCKVEQLKWDDELFKSPLPHPKNNAKFLKLQNKKVNLDIDKERKQFEELTREVLGKYKFSGSYKSTSNNTKKKTEIEELEKKEEKVVANMILDKIKSSESCKSTTNKDEKKTEIEEFEKKEEKVVRIFNYESELTINNEPEIEDIDIEDIKDIDLEAVEININTADIESIPELIITSQKSKGLECLDVKKINIEDKENTEDYDNSKEDKNVELNKENYERHRNVEPNKENHESLIDENRQAKINNANKKIDNFLDIIKKFQQKKLNKAKSDLTNSKHKVEQITAKVKPKSSSNADPKVASFEHRFKAQKDIIEMQKKKLEEQHRQIEDLKVNRIKSDARKSLENAKKIQQTILSDSKVKYRLKPEVKPETSEAGCSQKKLDLSVNSNKAPKIVKMMEERARERHEKRLLIQERKRLLQEEKQRLANELVQMKLTEKVEEKQERAKKLKKQRDTVRQMELKKQMEKERYLKLNEIAIEHNNKKLKQSAMGKFKMLIYNVKIRSEIANRFYENNIIIKCFLSWNKFVSNTVNVKNKIAFDLYAMKLMEQSLTSWKSYHFEAIQHNQVATDRYEMSLQWKYFSKWHKYICDFRVQNMVNTNKATKYYRRVLLFQCFSNWRSLPAIMQIERVQNERKRKWRLRVAEVLTDYDPLKSYDF